MKNDDVVEYAPQDVTYKITYADGNSVTRSYRVLNVKHHELKLEEKKRLTLERERIVSFERLF